MSYVVWANKGECSDTTIWIAGIYPTRGEAEAMVARCVAWLVAAVNESNERDDNELTPETVAACPDPVMRGWIALTGYLGFYDREAEWSIADDAKVLW